MIYVYNVKLYLAIYHSFLKFRKQMCISEFCPPVKDAKVWQMKIRMLKFQNLDLNKMKTDSISSTLIVY